jgi:hypothetical protein
MELEIETCCLLACLHAMIACEANDERSAAGCVLTEPRVKCACTLAIVFAGVLQPLENDLVAARLPDVRDEVP